MSNNSTASRACIALLLIAGLAGCGQKGPLYLPEAKPAPAPATVPAPTR